MTRGGSAGISAYKGLRSVAVWLDRGTRDLISKLHLNSKYILVLFYLNLIIPSKVGSGFLNYIRNEGTKRMLFKDDLEHSKALKMEQSKSEVISLVVYLDPVAKLPRHLQFRNLLRVIIKLKQI